MPLNAAEALRADLADGGRAPVLLVAGAGFVGRETLRQARGTYCSVAGIVRSNVPESPAPGEVMMAADLNDAAQRRAVAETLSLEDGPLHLVFAASAGGRGPETFRALFIDALGALLREWRPARVVLASSTSVYGQTDGSWVDELSPAEPMAENSRTLLEAERLVTDHGGIAARFSGLYGPGRCVYVRRLLEGTAEIEGDGGRWVNQLHRDDAACALVFLLAKGDAGSVYNVTDDTPRTIANLYEALAEHYKLPMPPYGGVRVGNRRRAVTNKRVSNARLRALGWSPRYPAIETALPV